MCVNSVTVETDGERPERPVYRTEKTAEWVTAEDGYRVFPAPRCARAIAKTRLASDGFDRNARSTDPDKTALCEC